MKHYAKTKLYVFLLRIAQALLFAIPFGIFMLIHRDTFFTQQSGIGISGLAVIGIIIYVLSLKHIFGKLPKILYFVVLWLVFLCMSMISDFLYQLGNVLIISAVLSLPVNFIIKAISVDGDESLREESKHRARQRIQKKENKIEVEVK